MNGWRKEGREVGMKKRREEGRDRRQELLKLQVDVVVMRITKHFNP